MNPKWVAVSLALASAVYYWRRKSKSRDAEIEELGASLRKARENCAAERQGRIKAQQALRKGRTDPSVELHSYPMAPIATIRSCFSTRNGTPRQPLLVPLAKACLQLDPARVPPASLQGVEGYSHCWILYVFHLNTDLEKMWKDPSRSKLKAKVPFLLCVHFFVHVLFTRLSNEQVRVPRLKGEKMGLFATRSPHRPCPIGLTVAKVEAVQGHRVLLSGVDLVDGTPVLDIKPYLPYCDSIDGARVPKWVEEDKSLRIASVAFAEGFTDTLAACWPAVEKRCLYTSQHEFLGLIEQALSWDIRSVSQRNRPHQKDVIYHLILEGLQVSYTVGCNTHILVHKVASSSQIQTAQHAMAS